MYSWKIAERDLLRSHILIIIERVQEDVFGPGKAGTQTWTHRMHACKHIHTSRTMRKRVLCHMRTTKAQISLRIRVVWSAPLLFAAQYNISTFYSRNFKNLASFCGCAGRFVSGQVGNSRRHVLSCRGSYKCQLAVHLPTHVRVWGCKVCIVKVSKKWYL